MQEQGIVLSKIDPDTLTIGGTTEIVKAPAPSLLKPEAGSLISHNCFMGLGYDNSGKLPIELATIVLTEKETKSLTLLIADYFLSLNGMPQEQISAGRAKLKTLLDRISLALNCEMKIYIASDHMNGGEYQKVFEVLNNRLQDPSYAEALRNTLPKRVRDNPTALLYPVHEIAISEYLRVHHDVTAKIGPGRERLYDGIMERLQLPIRFAYLLDALPLGGSSQPVVPYIANHHGSHAERVFLDDSQDKLKAKLLRGSDAALRNLARAGSAAGHALKRLFCTEEELLSLSGPVLRELTAEMLWKNIMEPVNLRGFPL